MEFFKFPTEALKEWEVLDKDKETTDADLKKWYLKWLRKIQDEVLTDEKPGNLIETLIKQYRQRKAEQIMRMKIIRQEIQEQIKAEQSLSSPTSECEISTEKM